MKPLLVKSLQNTKQTEGADQNSLPLANKPAVKLASLGISHPVFRGLSPVVLYNLKVTVRAGWKPLMIICFHKIRYGNVLDKRFKFLTLNTFALALL